MTQALLETGQQRLVVAAFDVNDAIQMHADALLDLAEVLRIAGRPEEAAPFAQEALRLYEKKGVLPSVERTRTLLAKSFASEAAR